MMALPHHYPASARGGAAGEVALSSARLPPIESDAPAEFGGSGERWSPETLLCAAVADCFVLTFRAVARASKLAYEGLRCDVEGKLDRIDGVTRFTFFIVRAELVVPPGADESRARALLEKAERACLISRSLVADVRLEASVVTRA